MEVEIDMGILTFRLKRKGLGFRDHPGRAAHRPIVDRTSALIAMRMDLRVVFRGFAAIVPIGWLFMPLFGFAIRCFIREIRLLGATDTIPARVGLPMVAPSARRVNIRHVLVLAIDLFAE